MKRCLLPILLCALLLCGCGTDRVQRDYASFAAELDGREELHAVGELRCEYSERSMGFTLRYELEGGEESVTVLAPESIAGIRARRSGGRTELLFDGLILDTGELDPYGLNPMNALPLLMDTLRHGHLDSWWTEGEETVLSLVRDDHLTVRVWFDAEMIPRHAELLSDDTVTVVIELSEWR